MADKLALMIEAERRGILPPEQTAMLGEARKRGLVPGGAASRPDPFADDELLSDEATQRLEATGASIIQPTPKPSPFSGVKKYLKGINEAAGEINRAKPAGVLGTIDALGTLATGAIAAPVLGTAESIVRGTPPEESFSRYTWQPRTESGKAQLGMLGALASPLTESGADIALLPLAAESNALRTIKRAPKEAPVIKAKPDPVPTTEELTEAARDAYKAGEESGVVVQPEGYAKALAKARTMAQKQGIDPTLHPKSTAVMKRLEGAGGKPMTLQDAETLRKIALDAEDDLNPVTREPTPDARLAGKIVDELDDAIEELSVNADARQLYSRSRRSLMLDRMIHRAEIRAGAHYTQAGMEHALRQEFKNLALNPRRMRGMTADQRAAVEKVAKGGAVENALRNLGKFDPTSGGMAAFTGGTLGLLSGGPLGLAIPAAGYAGKRAATRMTRGNVDAAREALVGRGVPKPAVAQAPVITGELTPSKPLALPAPSIIAGSRSAPGTAYARQEMGITPDVERAGALHPGVARESVIPRPTALPYRPASAAVSDQRPMIIDSQGRIAMSREQLRDYLRSLGMDRQRNVRQPNVGESRNASIGDEAAVANELPEVRQLELEAVSRRLFENPDPTPEQAAAESDWMKRMAAAKTRERLARTLIAQ